MRNFYTFWKERKIIILVSFIFSFTVFLPDAQSQVRKEFTPRTSSNSPNRTIYNLRGDYTIIGNTNLSLESYGDSQNNSGNMIYVDVDNDPSTLNSSSATLEYSNENNAIPECTSIIYAGLYWTGRAHDASSTGGNPQSFQATGRVKNGDMIPVPPLNSAVTLSHRQTNSDYFTPVTLAVTREGSSNSFTVVYTFTIGGNTVIFHHNFDGTVSYQIGGGEWASPDNVVSTTSGSGSNSRRTTTFDPVTIYAGSEGRNVTVSQLVRDSRGNQSATTYQNSATANLTFLNSGLRTGAGDIAYTDYRLTTTGSTSAGTVTYAFSKPGHTVVFTYRYTTPRYVRVSVNGAAAVDLPVASIDGTNAYLATPYTIYSGDDQVITVDRFYRSGNTRYAYLNISGNYSETETLTKTLDKKVVWLKHETADNYIRIDAQDHNYTDNIYYPQTDNSAIFVGYAEVTSYVQQYGTGLYSVADIALNEGDGGGTGFFGGWGLVVIYENASMTWRDIVVFDGYAYIQHTGTSGQGTTSQLLEVEGFHTVQEGEVNLKLGIMAGEGDVDISGDYFEMAYQANGDPGNTYGRFFRDGSINTSTSSTNTNFFRSEIQGDYERDLNLTNNTGIDIALFEIDNTNKQFVRNNQTRTRFRYGTNQDLYVIYCIVMGVDAYIPEPEVTNSVNKINGVEVAAYNPYDPENPVSGYTVQPGDTIQYILEIRNKSVEPLDSLMIRVPIPYTTIYPDQDAQLRATAEYSDFFLNSHSPQNSRLGFNNTSGASGTLEWYVGNYIPISPEDESLLAKLTFSVIVTDDCALLVGSRSCIPEAIVTGSSSGRGHDSGVPFNDVNFIYGKRPFPCEDEPINAPPKVSINASVECADMIEEGEIIIREIKLCTDSQEDIPFYEIANRFPTNTRFYNMIDEETGKPPINNNVREFTSSTNFPYELIANGALIYAVPDYLNVNNTCYWIFKIEDIPEITISGTGENSAICQRDSINLMRLVSVSEPGIDPESIIIIFYENEEGTRSISPIQTPSTTTTYYARAQVAGSSCFSGLFPLLITVTPTASVADMTNEICSGNTFLINPADISGNNVPDGTEYRWIVTGTIPGNISGAENGTGAIISGTLTNTGPVADSITYLITPLTTENGLICEGNSFELIITVHPLLPVPQPNDLTVCYGGDIDLTAALPLAGEFHFYTSATGGTPLEETLLTGVTSDRPYWVSIGSSGDCESERAQFFVRVEALPVPPTVNIPVPHCSGDTLTLQAYTTGDVSVRWYDETGTYLSDSNPYQTAITTAAGVVNRTFSVETVNNNTANNCPSDSRAQVTVTVKPYATPALISADDLHICSGSDTVLTALAPDVINPVFFWYDRNGILLDSGNTGRYPILNLNTPTTRDTLFQVAVSGDNYCINPADNRKIITVKINQVPRLTVTSERDSICFPGNFTLRTAITRIDRASWYGWFRFNAETNEYILDSRNNTSYSPEYQSQIGSIDYFPDEFVYRPINTDTVSNKARLQLRVQTDICGYIRDSIELTVLPFSTRAEMEIVNQPAGFQELCIDTVYEVKIKATGEGDVRNIIISLEDINTTFIRVDSACLYQYNNAGIPEGRVRLEIEEQFFPPVSSTTRWKFPDGYRLMPGDSAFIQIWVAADCGFYVGNNYIIRLHATGACGSSVMNLSQSTLPFILASEASSAYTFEIQESLTPEKLTAHDDKKVTWRAAYTVRYHGDEEEAGSTGEEYILAFLPAGLNEVDGSWRTNIEINGTILTRNDLDTIDDVLGREYTIPLPEGLKEGDTFFWEIQFDASGAQCETYEFSNEVFFPEAELTCGSASDECGVEILLGEGSYSTFEVDLYNFLLDIDQTPNHHMANSYQDVNSVWHANWYGEVLFKALSDFYDGDTIYIDFYRDVNNDNQLDNGDELIHQIQYITTAVDSGALFAVNIDQAQFIEVTEKDQLLAHLYNEDILCRQSVYPIVTLTGPASVCQGDTTIHMTAPGKKDYVFPQLDGTSGATPLRIPLEGRTSFTTQDDSIRLVWTSPGNYDISAVYSTPIEPEGELRLVPVKFPVTVAAAPVLRLTGTDTVDLCQGTTVELSQFVEEETDLDAEIFFYIKGNDQPLVPDSAGRIFDEPWQDRTYVVTAQTADCRSFANLELNVNVHEMPIISSIMVTQHPDCNQETGSIQMAISGGSGNYQYRVSESDPYIPLVENPEGMYTISGLGTGSYTVQIHDGTTTVCEASFSEPVTLTPVNSSLSARAVVQNAETCSSEDGEIRMIVNGGIPPYQYRINGNEYQNLPSDGIIGNDFQAGKYYIEVKDSTDCVLSLEETIIRNTSDLIMEFIQIRPADCLEPGWARLTVNGGAPNYSYQLNGQGWKPLNGNPLEGTLTPGFHEVRIKDSEGCEVSDTVLITQRNNLAILDVVTEDASCDGIESGTISFRVSGDANPFEYSIDGGNHYHPVTGEIISISGLSTGVYNILLRDTNGCLFTYENVKIGLTKEANIEIGTIRVVTQPDCDTEDGSIEITVYGGSDEYEYSLNGIVYYPLAPNGVIDSLKAGEYRFFVRDSRYPACPVVISPSLSLIPKNTDLTVEAIPLNASDCSNRDGQITLVVNGGTPPYQYSIDNEEFEDLPSDGIIRNLLPGRYRITVRDTANCEFHTREITVESGYSGMEVLWQQIVPATCDTPGEVLLTVSGGVPNYRYNLHGKDFINFSEDSIIISLPAGNHLITVEDANGCIVNRETEVSLDENEISVTDVKTTDADCDGTGGGTITFTLQGNGPFYYRLDTEPYQIISANPMTIEGLAEGNYTLWVRNSECETKYDNISIQTQRQAKVSIDAIYVVSQPGCNSSTGSIGLTVSGGEGGYFYRLNGAGEFLPMTGNTISGLPVGTYTVAVRDGNLSCPAAESDYISLTALENSLQLKLDVTHESVCYQEDGTITLLVGGGTSPYRYRIGNTGEYTDLPQDRTLHDLPSGPYTIMVEDADGCETSAHTDILAGEGLDLSYTLNPGNSVCDDDGSITIRMNGGTPLYSYRLNGNQYTSFTGDSVTIPLTPGQHTIRIRDARGCESEEIVTFPSRNGAIEVIAVRNATCEGTDGGSILARMTGERPVSYEIMGDTLPVNTNDSVLISGLAEGNYTIVFHYPNDCSYALHNIKIQTERESGIHALSIYITKQPDCGLEAAPGIVQVVAEGGSGNYLYSVDVPDINNSFPLSSEGIEMAAGSHIVYVWDREAQDCPPVQTNPIELTPKVHTLDARVTTTPASTCTANDGSIRLEINGADNNVRYKVDNGTWNPVPNDGNLGNYRAGEYRISIVDNKNCEIIVTAIVPATEGVSGLSVSEIRPANCTVNGLIEIALGENSIEENWHYLLDGKEWRPFVTDTVTEEVTAGWHEIWFRNQEGCLMSEQITVGNENGPSASLVATTDALCDGTYGGSITVNIEGVTAPFSIRNYGNIDTTGLGSGQVTLSGLPVGIYHLTVEDAMGCITTIEKIKIDKEVNYLRAVNDYAITYVDITVNGNVLANDYDYKGSTLQLADFDVRGLQGTIDMEDDGSFSYTSSTPARYDILPYTVTNSCGYRSDAILYILVQDIPSGQNRPPRALPDLYVTSAGLPVDSMDVRANDIDPDGGIISIPTIVSSVSYGTLQSNTDGTFTYLPNDGFIGTDSFTYRICNDNSLCDSTWVTIIVTPTVPGPVITAFPDHYITRQYEPLVIEEWRTGVLNNDIYPEGTTTVQIAESPAHGVVSLDNDGTFIYTPSSDYFGPDQFRYELCVEEYPDIPCSTTWVNIFITKNNCPVLLPPVVSNPQQFCGEARIANLQATGQNIKWYESPVGYPTEVPLAENTLLADGKIYYATQGSNECESPERSPVKVRIVDSLALAAPVITSPVYYCGTGTTLEELFPRLNHTTITWYNESMVAIDITEPIENNMVLYARSEAGWCESADSTIVTVYITNETTLPSPVVETPQEFCPGAMVSDIKVNGDLQIVWYPSPENGQILPGNSFLQESTYYAAFLSGDCESSQRTPVEILINQPGAPEAPGFQEFCDGATIGDLEVTGYGVSWFKDESSSIRISPDSLLVSGIYYAAQTSEECEGERVPVQVNIIPRTSAALITSDDVEICTGESATLTASVSGGNNPVIRWYDSNSENANLLATSASYVTGELNAPAMREVFYYVSAETDGFCETPAGQRKEVKVTVHPIPEIRINADNAICLGDSVGLNVTVLPEQNVVSYKWLLWNGTDYTQENLVISPTPEGSNANLNNNRFWFYPQSYQVVNGQITLGINIESRFCGQSRAEQAMNILPLPADGDIRIIYQPETAQMPCEDTVYVLRISETTGLGGLKDILVTMNDHRSTGLTVTKAEYFKGEIREQSIWSEMDLTGGSGDSLEYFFMSIPDPDFILFHDDSLLVRVTVETGCEFFAGSTMLFALDANMAGCDEGIPQAIGQKVTESEKYVLDLFDEMNVAEYVLNSNLSFNGINPGDSLIVSNNPVLGSTVTWTISFERIDNQTNNEKEALYFLLPPGVRLLPNSIQEVNTNYYGPGFDFENALEITYADAKGIEWMLPLPENDNWPLNQEVTIRFQFEVNKEGDLFSVADLLDSDDNCLIGADCTDTIRQRSENAKAECGNYPLYVEIIFEKDSVFCSSLGDDENDPDNYCVFYNTLGSHYPNLSVEWYEFQLAQGQASLGTIRDGKWYGEFDIIANNEFFAGDTIRIEFYVDVNNNSTLDGADTMVNYFFEYITSTIPADDNFIIHIGDTALQNGVPLSEGKQLLARVHGKVLCEEMVFPIVTFFGEEEFCMGEREIFSTVPGMTGYSYNIQTVPAGGTVPTPELMGNEYTIAYTFDRAGQYRILTTYSPGGGRLLTPVAFYITVHPNPSLIPADSSMTICEGESADLTMLIADQTQYGGSNSTISYYIKETHVQLLPDSNGKVWVTPRDTTVYLIRGESAFGCTDSTEFTINVIPVPRFGSVFVENQAECGDSTGSIRVVLTGGSGNYLYNFDNSDTKLALPSNGMIDNLAIGSYRIYAWDASGDGCSAALSDIITLSAKENNLRVAAMTTPSAGCDSADGTIRIEVSGGNGIIEYSIDNSGYTTIPADGIIGTSYLPGEYEIVVRDAGGCTSSALATVISDMQDVGLQLTERTAANCDEEGELEISLNSVGNAAGWVYRLNGGAWGFLQGNSITERVYAGNYVIEVRDTVTGCRTRDSITISNQSLMEIRSVETSDALCDGTYGGSVTMDINGGTPPYRITDGGRIDTTSLADGIITITGLSVGTYYLTVADANNCIVNSGSVSIDRGSSLLIAENDVAVTYMNIPVEGQLFANDYDSEFSRLGLVSHTVPSHGSISVEDDGRFVYTPNNGYSGSDSVVYTVRNACGFTSPATLFISVLPLSSDIPPIAIQDIYYTGMNLPVTNKNTLDNDVIGSGTLLSVSLQENVMNGNLIWNGDGTFSYVPENGYVGADQFSYEICTEYGCSETWVTIWIVGRDTNRIIALPDAYSVNQSDTLHITASNSILQNDIFPAGTPRIHIVDQPAHGTMSLNADGSFVYVPDGTFYGTETFIYSLCMEEYPTLECDTALVTILVYTDCNDVEFEIICPSDTMVFLPYGDCEYVFESLGTPSYSVNGSYPGGLHLVYTRMPADTVFPAGQHRIVWYATNECGRTDSCYQWVIVNHSPCNPVDTVWTADENHNLIYHLDSLYAIDYEGTRYPTVRIGCDCWTAENLRSTLDRQGNPVESTIYHADLYPDTTENVKRYGRLYTWSAALLTRAAVIPGICPAGWALPSVEQYENLIPYGSDALRKPNEWLEDNTATNTTGFSAVPAGYYNGNAQAHYLLLGDAFFWTSENSNETIGKVAHIRYICPVLEIKDMTKTNGASIRCIKVND